MWLTCRAQRLHAPIDAAETARHAWAARTGKDRAAILRKMHDLMMAMPMIWGLILTAEMGKPLAEARGEIAYGASLFSSGSPNEAKRIYGETIPGPHTNPTKRLTVLKQPTRRGCCDLPHGISRMP